jgi:hypothetical protein
LGYTLCDFFENSSGHPAGTKKKKNWREKFEFQKRGDTDLPEKKKIIGGFHFLERPNKMAASTGVREFPFKLLGNTKGIFSKGWFCEESNSESFFPEIFAKQ